MSLRGKILFITSRFPFPLDKGDKLRAYFQLKHLADEYEVHVIAINETKVPDKDFNAVSPFCASIQVFVIPLYKRFFSLITSVFSRIPLQVAFFYNKGVKKKIHKIIKEVKPYFIHCHLVRTTEYVKEIQHVRKSLDFMDAFAHGMKKRQDIERNLFKRLLFRYEKNLLLKYESSMFDFIDKFSIISEQDRHSIPNPGAREIHIIPNGVDFETFYPRAEEKIYDILFMGNLAYPPNIAALEFLSGKVMPLVQKSMPEVKLLIAGVDACRQIKRMKTDNIEVIENFEDISDAIAISKIMVAPMHISIGLQNKVLQAMAMKTPCIVSTSANNAIHAPINKAIIEANTELEFAGQILELLNNEDKAREIGQAGFEFVLDNYSWSKQNSLLTSLLFNRN